MTADEDFTADRLAYSVDETAMGVLGADRLFLAAPVLQSVVRLQHQIDYFHGVRAAAAELCHRLVLGWSSQGRGGAARQRRSDLPGEEFVHGGDLSVVASETELWEVPGVFDGAQHRVVVVRHVADEMAWTAGVDHDGGYQRPAV